VHPPAGRLHPPHLGVEALLLGPAHKALLVVGDVQAAIQSALWGRWGVREGDRAGDGALGRAKDTQKRGQLVVKAACLIGHCEGPKGFSQPLLA
jgi:hypothetical protein